MLESYITPILMSYVDKYIKNLKPSDLNLSLWGGDVSLTNLELNLHALEKELSFPVTFLSGKIHELNIHVPWTQLYSEPAVITINTIECVLKLKETNFPAEGLDEATEIQQADIKATSAATAPQTESEKALPPGYVQSLLNKVIYNLTVKVNNFVLKYIEDDIVLSLNVKSAEFHSANENWVKAFVDVAAPDWVLHKMCNISDLTVCLDRRNASGIIEIYQDPLAYRCNLSCRMQVHYDKDGFHLPLEKNLSVYCECLEVSITDQQLPLLLRLLKLGLSVYYGTLDLPGCEPPTHSAKDIVEKKGQNSSQNIMSTLPATFGVETDTELSETGWLSWAYSMVPGLSGDQRTSDALLAPLVSRFGVYISQASLSFKVTEPMSEGNFLGAQRFEFKPILTLEASGVAQEMVTKGSSFFDFQMGVTSVTGWLVDECVCKNQERGRSDEGDGTTREPEEELFLRVGGKDTSVNKGIAFLKGSLFDLESTSTEQRRFTADAEEFSRTNSESNVLSRFGAMFFEYLYSMDIESDDESSYYESTPAVREESHQRIIMGPSTIEITSGVFHRMEMVMKLSEDDANLRKEKDEIFYDEFVEDQLLSGNVSFRDMHVTVLDSSLVIMMSDHVKTAQTQNEPAVPSEGTLSEIQEEEIESRAKHSTVRTGCVFQVERLDIQKTSPMFPKEMMKLIKQRKGSKALLQNAHNNMYAKVFGFQVGVSKHELDAEDPMILNILPACNMSLFAKQSLVPRKVDALNDIEGRFELASLSLNITKPQLVLLQDIHQSWTCGGSHTQSSLSGSSLVLDVFHPSAKQGGKIPVLIEAFVQDIKVQLHMTSEEISSSGSVASIKATVMSLSGETAESTPVLYGPLITADIYSGECFKSDENRSFKVETLDPWLAFTVKIPLTALSANNEENRPQGSGAILLKCNGTVINLDPVLFTWLAYYPRMSSVVDSSSRGWQSRKAASHTRSVSTATPRKKSYARSNISPSHTHKKKKRYSQQRKRQESVQDSAPQDFDGWVWEKLPLLASFVIQVDVESVVFFAPAMHLPYDNLPVDCYDIPRNFIHQLHKRDPAQEPISGLVLSLPTLKIRSSGHQDLAICHDILRHPLTLPPRDQPETLPWILTAEHASVFTVRMGGDRKDIEVYFVLSPMCCRAMLASAKTSHSGNVSGQNEAQKATLDFVLHTDFNPLTMNCSKKQVDLLFQLYSNAVQLTSSVSANASSHESESLYPARSISGAVTGTGRTIKRTASVTSSSGFDIIDDESVSSESTPKPSVTSLEAAKVSESSVHVSLWVQWTLPKLSFNIFGSDDGGSDLRITTELEDWSASFDYQNGHFKAQCKVGNFSITHYEIGSPGQWVPGPGGGTILARQDSLSSSLSKAHDFNGDDSDPGPHGFLYVEYTASSVAVPSFRASFEHDDVFQNSFGYSQDVHVTIQPFDFILWCPLLYTVTTVFQTFTSLQGESVGKCESQGVPLPDPTVQTLQSLTNLPEVNLRLRGFRVVVPSCLEPRELKVERNTKNGPNYSDLFTIQASSLLISSRLENPISRLVVDKKLSKALTGFARSRRGSATEKASWITQYKIEVKGLRVWSGCWEELCRMLPDQDTSRIERDLLEQNPALEWNTYSGQGRTSALVIPLVSDLDIKCVVAPPISLASSSNSQCWTKPIFGLSFEVNLTTDVECFISKSQIQLMQNVLKVNIMNSGVSNDDVTSDVTANADKKTLFSHPPKTVESPDKLDSGIGSECSHRKRHVTKKTRDKTEVQEMECLFTAGGLSLFVYEHSSTGEARTHLVPVIRASLIQPSFSCTRRTDCDTIQISCFDISLAKSRTKTRISDDTRLVPGSDDYDVTWFRTGDGSPDKHTELSPAFVTFTSKLYPTTPADLKLDFGRPIWIDVDLALLDRLNDFASDLNMPQTKLDSGHRNNSDSEMTNIVRSVAISTDYVAITATAGQDREIDPLVKVACSSMNLGASLKADQRQDFCQRVAGNLRLCALTISTSIEDELCSFLLPYDASIDLELFCNSPSVAQDPKCVSAVEEIFIWLDSGFLQVNFGQEHLRCLNGFTERVLEFINTHFEGSASNNIDANSDSVPAPSPNVHRSDDDLRTGPFRYNTSAASNTRPNPYEIVFSDEGLPTMSWRYPEPRALSRVHIIPVPFTTFTSYPSPVMEEDRLLPCILRYWDNIQKSYAEHSTFYISESTSTDVSLCNPVTSPLSEVIAASEWQVIANIAMTSDDSEMSMSDDDDYSMFSERSNIPSPISATSLAACMKVDSIFCSNLVPKLSFAATVNTMQLTIYNHMENMHSAVAEKFEGYTLQDEIPKSQEFLRVTAENSTIIVKSWPTNTMQCLVWSNTHADVLDYRELRWKSLLSHVDITLAFLKSQNMQKGDEDVPAVRPDDCSFGVSCGDIVVDASQSRIHTLSAGMLAWQEKHNPVLSHFIICNNTNHVIRFGQDGTEESIVLRSKELTFYSWMSRNDLCHQKLHLCLDEESRWCEAFGIDSPGVTNRAVQFSVHTATLIIEVRKKSGLQREVIIHSSHVVQNYTSHDVEVQLLQNPAVTQVTSPTLQVLHSIAVPAHSSSPSYVVSHGGLAGIRVRLRGETTWSGTLPIEDQLPNFQQHCVVQMLGTKEFKNFYIWYNAVCVDSLIGQIEISFSPLFVIKNYLPQTIQLTAISASGDVTTTHDAPGESQEHQLFDLPPDSWHYVTFKLPDANVSSNPSVPLNTTLHELTEKVKRDEENGETPDIKWPYSSNSWKTSKDPYLKPVESTLLRHVQSSQDDTKSDEGRNESDVSCVELQCQILNKWKKLRSILLEVKPRSLFENKSCLTLHLKDETGKSVHSVKPGKVISPTKLESFCVGVLPPWLDEIIWSESISLADSDHPQAPVSGNSLQQYGYLKCAIIVPSPSGKKLCSLLLTSSIVKGIRIVTLQETTRLVCSALPRPLLVQPVVVNDVTSKLKETAFCTDTEISLKENTDIASQGIPFWNLSSEKNTPETSTSDLLCVLVFGLPTSPDDPTAAPTSTQWSRPVRIQQGIIRQCLFLQTSEPDPPLAVVVVTLIENGLTKVVITEDQVPRMLLTNRCATPIQFGQCPSSSDKQKAKGTTLSGRDLVVSENLEQYTTLPRLDSNCSVYYEPSELREGFLTKKPQTVPQIRTQILKETHIKELPSDGSNEIRDKIIYMPQGWSDAMDVFTIGNRTYNLPGNYRLHVQVMKKTSFLTHVVFSETCNELKSTEDVREGGEVKINCNVSNFSVCLHDESSWLQATEVFRINLEDLALSALFKNTIETCVELNLAGLQIDNQMTDDFYDFPVVLLPLDNESRNTKRKEKLTLKPLLNCCLDFSTNSQKTHVHLLSIHLEPLSVFIEDTFLYRLAGMLDSFILPESDRPTEPCGNIRISSDGHILTFSEDRTRTHEHFRIGTEGESTPSDKTRSSSDRTTVYHDDFRALSLASAATSPVLIDRISIEPVYVLVTFHASVKVFVSANHTPLSFSRFEMTSLFTDPSFLAQLLAVHYAYSALMKVGWVVGSLDIIGSPAGFVRSVGQGVADFFYLPYDGLTRGPTAFVTGMTRGMSSFMSHISAGALTSVTNLASSISRNMDRLSFDEQHVRFQEQQRADGVPRRVISGFTHGLSGLMLSVLGAVAGVADQPLQELFRAESVRDVTSGLIAGVGKGLIGVVTKPLGGAMELVSQTGQGILQGTGLGEMPMRLYEAHEGGDFVGSSSSLKYLWKLLESKSSADLFAVTVSVLVSGNSHFDATLIMSCDSIMFLDADDDTILSAFVLRQVDMREDPQHPRAIIVEHHVPGTDTISEVSSFAELSPTNTIPSRDVTNRALQQSFSENDAVNLTLFMDPVYLRPLLSRFKLLKSGY